MADQIIYLNRNSVTSPLFSKLGAAIADGKQGRAKPPQWKATIQALTQKGIKSAEIEDASILGWLESQHPDTPLTKEQVAARIESSLPTIKEVLLQSPKYPSYRQPGGNYGEYLYILNSEKDNVIDDLELVEYRMQELAFEVERIIDDPELPIRLERERERLIDAKGKATDFTQHHYSDIVTGRLGKNLMAHARVTLYPESGIYFVNEIQSDWAQHGRRNNWSQAFPKAPFVTSTEAWAGAVLRRHLQIAAQGPTTSKFAWITETMRNGGQQNSEAERNKLEMKKRYDEGMAKGLAEHKGRLKEGLSPEEVQAHLTQVRPLIVSELRSQGIYDPPDMLNEFYLKVLPKIVDKILAGTGEKVSMQTITIGDRTVTVPTINITDAVRQRLIEKQPLYSHGGLAFNARTLDDPALVNIVSNVEVLLGSTKHFRLVNSLYDTATGRRVPGRYVNKLVQVSLAALNIEEVTDHECFHFAQENLLDQRELQILDVEFAQGSRLNRAVLDLLRSRGDHALAKQCERSADEAAAQGFALWRQGKLQVTEPPVRGIFSDIITAVKDVVSWIQTEVFELKLQTVEDIFSAFASGEIASRKAERDASHRHLTMAG